MKHHGIVIRLSLIFLYEVDYLERSSVRGLLLKELVMYGEQLKEPVRYPGLWL